MALVLPRGEIFLWGRNFCRIILGILAALLAAKTVRNRTKRHKTPTKRSRRVERKIKHAYPAKQRIIFFMIFNGFNKSP